jgi:hypothetical protein
VQSSYFEHVLVAITDKLGRDLNQIPDGPTKLNCISSAGLEETDRFLVQEEDQVPILPKVTNIVGLQVTYYTLVTFTHIFCCGNSNTSNKIY